MRTTFFLCLVCLCTFYATAAWPATAGDADKSCLNSGQWATPNAVGARPATPSRVLDQARSADFVLLGETHDNRAHHLWQLQALAMLLGTRDRLVIGMEMFPRRVQTVLDRWIAGELTEAQFLEESDWYSVWAFDPELYMPILRFARLNRIPLIALNVERSLISETAAGGWQSVAAERREGVSDPAPPLAAYRESLASSFQQHGARDDSALEYFVQAQLVWDRAFAQGLADASRAHRDALVVGIIGTGHLRYGHGVPHQLGAMGKDSVVVWLPQDVTQRCADLATIADAVFAASDGERAAPPRLGVYLTDAAAGAEVREVMPGSVAEQAGLASGDRIIAAAGVKVSGSNDVIAIVHRQSPGTWLPVTVSRNGNTIELVAQFPAASSEATGVQP